MSTVPEWCNIVDVRISPLFFTALSIFFYMLTWSKSQKAYQRLHITQIVAFLFFLFFLGEKGILGFSLRVFVCSITWSMPLVLFCISFFFQIGFYILAHTRLKTLSSYLYLWHSWDYKCEPLHLVGFLICSLTNFLPILALNCDHLDLCLSGCWLIGVSHDAWLLSLISNFKFTQSLLNEIQSIVPLIQHTLCSN